MTFDEARLWSTMSPYPVFFNKGCFWCGCVMTKQMAMCLVGTMFFKIGLSPNQKQKLWEGSVEQYRELDAKHQLNFNIFDYNYDNHYSFLAHRIHENIKDLPLEYTKEQFIENFLVNQ